MSDQRSTPFSKTSAAAAQAAPSVPPVHPISTDPSDAPLRILLNWIILCGGLGAILFAGGVLL
jgi:hypothetical protein